MESFKRMNANSKLKFVFFDNFKESEFENQNTMILQIVPIPTQILEFNGKTAEINPTGGITHLLCIEYISRLEEENVPATFPSNAMPRGDIDFENFLDTTINKDPFGGKWSGKTIRAVFEAGDAEWVHRAMTEMRNEFIRSKLEYVMQRGGYGKVRN